MTLSIRELKESLLKTKGKSQDRKESLEKNKKKVNTLRVILKAIKNKLFNLEQRLEKTLHREKQKEKRMMRQIQHLLVENKQLHDELEEANRTIEIYIGKNTLKGVDNASVEYTTGV